MAGQRVRPALPEDPLLLAQLQRTWWRDAYGGILPANVLDMDELAHAEAWTMQLIGARGLIAEEATHPVGFALVDPNPGADGVGRIELLGVVPRWAHRGHGGRLLVEAARLLREAGAETAALWVVESDPSYPAFLAGAGWQEAGRRRVFDTGAGKLIEVEYSGSTDLHLDDEYDEDPGGGADHEGHDHRGHSHPH